ncbi:MAG: DUF6745 domain-containing protein [Desulfomonilaceae bacterium]
MNKIKPLTPDQEQKLSSFLEEWYQWGICTDRADRPKAETAISKMFRRIKKEPPKTFAWCKSPATALMALQVLKHSIREDDLKAPLWGRFCWSLGEGLPYSFWESLRGRHRDPLWGGLWEGLPDSFWESFRGRHRDPLWGSLWEGLRDSIRESLRDSIRDSIRDLIWGRFQDAFWDGLLDSLPIRLRDGFEKSLREQWYGQHDSYWISFDLFCRDIMGVKYESQESEELDLWRDIAQSACWWWPYKNFCVISERPILVRMQEWSENRHRLHCENGPALAFSDGWKVYALNGVRVPSEIVKTPAAKLDLDLLLRERNAEIRREIVRKIGIERIMSELKTEILDERNGYQLLIPDLQDGRKRPYLKMLNPSEGTWHIEGVHADCKTVSEALEWRNNDNLETEILT